MKPIMPYMTNGVISETNTSKGVRQEPSERKNTDEMEGRRGRAERAEVDGDVTENDSENWRK